MLGRDFSGTGRSPFDPGSAIARDVGMQTELHESAIETRPAMLEGYGGGDDVPLGGYALLAGTYATLFAAGLARLRKKLPRRYSLGDLFLLGIATHKLSRTLVKAKVTSPIRAPFVRYEGSAGVGELKESSRGHGLRRAIGDLLTCPWCAGPWIAAPLFFGFVSRPRTTRALAAVATAVTISDFLQHAQVAAKEA